MRKKKSIKNITGLSEHNRQYRRIDLRHWTNYYKQGRARTGQEEASVEAEREIVFIGTRTVSIAIKRICLLAYHHGGYRTPGSCCPTIVPPSHPPLEGDSNPIPIYLILHTRRVVDAALMSGDCSCVSFFLRWSYAHQLGGDSSMLRTAW